MARAEGFIFWRARPRGRTATVTIAEQDGTPYVARLEAALGFYARGGEDGGEEARIALQSAEELDDA